MTVENSYEAHYPYAYGNGQSGFRHVKKITVKEYDEKGKLVRETITVETSTPDGGYYWIYPSTQTHPTWTVSSSTDKTIGE